MKGTYAFLIAVVFFIVAINFFLLFIKLKRNRPRKSGKAAMEENEAAIWRDKEIQRRLEREQEDAKEYIDRQNKTFELYEQVRKNAANEIEPKGD